MFGKPISRLFNFIVLKIKSVLLFIINIPNYIKNKILDFRNYVANYKHKLLNIAESNFELGIYHLELYNLDDAILRFKLLDKFFKKGDPEVRYLLGLAYHLKNNVKVALYYLNKSTISKAKELEDFIKNAQNLNEIPIRIWKIYRNLAAAKFKSLNPLFKTEYLVEVLKKNLDNFKVLPDNYKILEIGANIGFAGEEIKRRFPDSAHLTGAEYSDKMFKLLTAQNPSYDQAILIQDYEFIKNLKDKYYIIISFCGFSYVKNLRETFEVLQKKLDPKGYFAFCVRSSNQTLLDLNKKEFTYAQSDIESALDSSNLNILYKDKIFIEKNEKYLIFVCNIKI